MIATKEQILFTLNFLFNHRVNLIIKQVNDYPDSYAHHNLHVNAEAIRIYLAMTERYSANG